MIVLDAIKETLDYAMLTKYGSHILTAAIARNALRDFLVLSYQVAMRRNCFSLLNIRSMRLRSI